MHIYYINLASGILFLICGVINYYWNLRYVMKMDFFFAIINFIIVYESITRHLWRL